MSQGIEPVIDYSTDEDSWGLLVPQQHHENALTIIRQYQSENRHWPWRKELFHIGPLFDAASLLWGLLAVFFFWLSNDSELIVSIGVMDTLAVMNGQWWRLFTAPLLHADLAHLTTNLIFGVLLLGLAMGRYGTGIGILSSYLAGVGGNLVSWCFSDEPQKGLGASGMIMGALGLLAAQPISKWHISSPTLTRNITTIAAGVLLFVLLGSRPGTDFLAHLGGFASGLLLGSLLVHTSRFAQSVAANLAAGLGFGFLVILGWTLAFTKST